MAELSSQACVAEAIDDVNSGVRVVRAAELIVLGVRGGRQHGDGIVQVVDGEDLVGVGSSGPKAAQDGGSDELLL